MEGEFQNLDDDQSRHLIKVLRVQPGQEIEVFNGRGQVASALIQPSDSKKRITAQIGEVIFHDPPEKKLHIAASLVKSSLFEDAFEQSIELGLSSFTPIKSDFCVVRLDAGKIESRMDRFERLAIERLKQCEQKWLPEIRPFQGLQELVEQSLLQNQTPIVLMERVEGCHLSISIDTLVSKINSENCIFLIGPEGGWSPEERAFFEEKKIPALSLGDSILRTETAFVALAATVVALTKV